MVAACVQCKLFSIACMYKGLADTKSLLVGEELHSPIRRMCPAEDIDAIFTLQTEIITTHVQVIDPPISKKRATSAAISSRSRLLGKLGMERNRNSFVAARMRAISIRPARRADLHKASSGPSSRARQISADVHPAMTPPTGELQIGFGNSSVQISSAAPRSGHVPSVASALPPHTLAVEPHVPRAGDRNAKAALHDDEIAW